MLLLKLKLPTLTVARLAHVTASCPLLAVHWMLLESPCQSAGIWYP